MASMNMRRAFNSKMLTKIKRYAISGGAYNEDNDWVQGNSVVSDIYGVIKAGNKFSQFDEGISKHLDEGGIRNSDYWSLYVVEKFALEMNDKVYFHGRYYNVIQESDETEFGFHSYLIERVHNWEPPT
mgnify:FL=1